MALAYNIGISVNRDSDDNDVKRAFRKVSAKVHPDKGGATADFQSLNAARDAWLQAARAKTTDKGSGSASSSSAKAEAPGTSLLQFQKAEFVLRWFEVPPGCPG